ncbi:hypothetical protein GCM10027169_01740 [Gordonia jinhuaensis]|nr:DUF2613 domain-containing protein [Gordonia jinhuaensis]
MSQNRLIAGSVAAIAGLIVAICAVFLTSWLTTDTTPSTSLNRFSASNGFVEGSVDYGSRGDAEVNN